MTRATVLQEVRQMRFEELYARHQRRDLTMAEAAEMLGSSERTFRRWRDRYAVDGAAGLEDRRLGRASARAAPVDEVLQMVTLYETRYTGLSNIFMNAGTPSMAGPAPIRGPRTGSKRLRRSAGPPGGGRIARSDPANRCPA